MQSDTDVSASSYFYSHDLIVYCLICPDVWLLLKSTHSRR